MNVLVIGNGAREHTLVWKISQSYRCEKLFAAPGNAGTALIAANLDIPSTDLAAMVRAAKDNEIDLVIIGPEAPLTEGLADELSASGIPVFGPSKGASQIEGSKVFAKELMFKYGIPCANSATFSSFEKARNYVKNHPVPLVIKADGLAAGKGVIIASSQSEAIDALDRVMRKREFGNAGDRVLVEECLTGREASLLAFADGESVSPMIPACDYKRAFDGDKGLNTGGMGCYAPSEFLTDEMRDSIVDTVIERAVKAMANEGYPYKGVLYAGLMITENGPKVLEFNARLGDPETQVILPLLKTDIVEIAEAVINGNLSQVNIEWSDEACAGVVLASEGYPESYRKGFPISGLNDLDQDIMVFHAGTSLNQDGRIVTSGGRVITVAAKGATLIGAREKVYSNVSRIDFDGCWYRRDIAMI
ncbi:MAG: phosphoribosylamine--glycine ligase [Dehalococcoidia bacterium]